MQGFLIETSNIVGRTKIIQHESKIKLNTTATIATITSESKKENKY